MLLEINHVASGETPNYNEILKNSDGDDNTREFVKIIFSASSAANAEKMLVKNAAKKSANELRQALRMLLKITK